MGRLDKGQHIYIGFAIFVLKGYRRYLSTIHRRHMNAAAVHKPASKCNTLGRVVVSAYDKNMQLFCRQTKQKVVKYLNSLG